jgi:tetratricopeptide (TPR) repeat protein
VIEHILQADRHLQVDQVEQARAIFQRVVDTDPGNAIAVVGLARCASADGDDQSAYELASRALQIDPENDMARRMEARLSEILAARGEPVERPPVAATPGPPQLRALARDDPAPPPATGSPPPATGSPPPATASPPPATASPPPATASPPPGAPARKSLVDRLLGR